MNLIRYDLIKLHSESYFFYANQSPIDNEAKDKFTFRPLGTETFVTMEHFRTDLWKNDNWTKYCTIHEEKKKQGK